MQQAETPSSRRVRTVSPGKAFLGLAVVAIASGVLVVTRADSPVAPPSPAPSAAGLTEADARAEFENLHEQLLLAYERRDLSAIDQFAAAGSPLERTVRREISQLIEDDVFDFPVFETRSIEVLTLGDSRIVLRQVGVRRGHFENAKGENITAENEPQLLTIDWTLVSEPRGWRLQKSLITRARSL